MVYYNETDLSEGIDSVTVAKVRTTEYAWFAIIDFLNIGSNFKNMFVMVAIWYDDVVS